MFSSFSPVQDLFRLKNQYFQSRKVLLLDQSRVPTKKYGNNSLAYIFPKLWNELDNNFKLSDSVHFFKQQISQWMGPKCLCKFCMS